MTEHPPLDQTAPPSDPEMYGQVLVEQDPRQTPFTKEELDEYLRLSKEELDLDNPGWGPEQTRARRAALAGLQNTADQFRADPNATPDSIVEARLVQVTNNKPSDTASPERRTQHELQTGAISDLWEMLGDPTNRQSMREWMDDQKRIEATHPNVLPGHETFASPAGDKGEDFAEAARRVVEGPGFAAHPTEAAPEPRSGGASGDSTPAAHEQQPAAQESAPDQKGQKLRAEADRLLQGAKTSAETKRLRAEQESLVPAAQARDAAALKRYKEIDAELGQALFTTGDPNELGQVLTLAGFTPENVARLVNDVKGHKNRHPESVFSVTLQRDEDGEIIQTPMMGVAQNQSPGR